MESCPLLQSAGSRFLFSVPFDETLLKSGVKTSLAVGLFVEQKVGLAGAARIAGISPSEMMDILAERKIPLVDYSKEELADELDQFNNE
jgi:predicted HTH domain antitoxin